MDHGASGATSSWVGFGEQRLDVGLDLIVGALADVNITNTAAFVNQVKRRPVIVVVSIPGVAVIILGHGVGNAVLDDGLLNVVPVIFGLVLMVVMVFLPDGLWRGGSNLVARILGRRTQPEEG